MIVISFIYDLEEFSNILKNMTYLLEFYSLKIHSFLCFKIRIFKILKIVINH